MRNLLNLKTGIVAAMCVLSAHVGANDLAFSDPRLAMDALLKAADNRNFYDQRGVNTGGPCPYLPGIGRLL